MSWSLPREIFRPQRDSRSSDGSVRRPDFCTASFRRVSSMAGDFGFAGGFAISFGISVDALGRELITAIACRHEPGNAPDGGDTDTGEAVNLPIGEAFAHVLHHGPAV